MPDDRPGVIPWPASPRPAPRLAALRNSPYARAVGTGVINRLVAVGCRFIAVPLMLNLLDPERYGLWLLITSFLMWLGLADMGMPAALQSPLISAVVRRDGDTAQRMLAYSWRRLLRNGALIAAATVAFVGLAPVGRIFNVGVAHRTEFAWVILASAVVFSMSLPYRLTNTVAYATGRLFLPPLLDLVGQILSLLVLVVLVLIRLRSLFVPLFATSLVTLVLCGGTFWWLCSSVGWRHFLRRGPVTAREKTHLTGRGMVFLLITVGEVLVLQTDNFIIGGIKGPAAITKFAVPGVFVLQFLMLQNMFLRPLWPIVSQAVERRDVRRLRRLFLVGITLSLLVAAVYGMFLGIWGGAFIRLWTHGQVTLPPRMAWGFALYILVNSPCAFLATYCNASDLVHGRLVGIFLWGVAKVAVTCWWLNRWGLETLPFALAVVAIPTDGLVLVWNAVAQLVKLQRSAAAAA